MSLNKIENVANWYISKEGLYRANHQIIQAIDKLSLPNLLLNGRMLDMDQVMVCKQKLLKIS